MLWMFVVDIAFYSVIGVVSVPLLILGTAVLEGLTYTQAQENIKRFLRNWGTFASQGFLSGVLRLGGMSSAVFLLAFTAYTANRLGDAALPHTAAAFEYFSSDEVQWSIQWKGEWRDVKRDLREVAGIRHDRLEWEKAKAEMGKYDVRFCRTIAVMSFGLAVVASLDLLRRRSRKNALRTAILAWMVVVLAHWLWVDRQEQYIENLTSRYCCEYKRENRSWPTRPANWPSSWPGGDDGASPQERPYF